MTSENEAHESFKQSLVNDVFGAAHNNKHSNRIPMDKVTLLIWLYRTDPELVTFITDFLAQYSSSQKYVFDDIEFYTN